MQPLLLRKHPRPLGSGQCLSQRMVRYVGAAGFAPMAPQVGCGASFPEGAGVVVLKVGATLHPANLRRPQSQGWQQGSIPAARKGGSPT